MAALNTHPKYVLSRGYTSDFLLVMLMRFGGGYMTDKVCDFVAN